VPVAVRRGPIIDTDGSVVGEHRGLAYYTVGQRRGLGVANSAPRYVTELLPERNALVVGAADALVASGLEAVRPRYVRGEAPADDTALDAVVRYRGTPAPAHFRRTDDGFALRFDSAVRAVAPGQAVVLYVGDEVIGGGTISRAR
jgi:tRNA-specific 2-thiouridylase